MHSGSRIARTARTVGLGGWGLHQKHFTDERGMLSSYFGTICQLDERISFILICPAQGWNIRANVSHSSSCSKPVATSLCIFLNEQTNKRAFNKWRVLSNRHCKVREGGFYDSLLLWPGFRPGGRWSFSCIRPLRIRDFAHPCSPISDTGLWDNRWRCTSCMWQSVHCGACM